jgi:catalase-peroxidase
MKKHHLLVSTIISGFAAVSLSTAAIAMTASGLGDSKSNQFWWPKMLDLSPLRAHDVKSNPYGASFNYAEEFKTLDLDAVKKDINTLLTTSQDWWPADYGNYGPFFIRMAWHSAGTYRMYDGRGGSDGGQQRFEPLNSWPDNANLDKARRLLWPVKQKYGRKISWGDLMVLTGNVALENMGFKPYGFAGGRADDWEPDLVYWGPEKTWLASERHDQSGKLKRPFGATQMGLIYVNPEGPNGNHDPLSAAQAIREAFGGMAMSDEETIALIAGGHTFGKAHGAHAPSKCVGAEPAAAETQDQGFGWHNKCGKGNAEDTTTSGLEGAWTATPVAFSMQYLDNLFNFEWVKTKSPAGATQWVPKDAESAKMVPDAHIEGKLHAPIMFTTDIALKEDPEFAKIAKRFQENPEAFKDAFAKAWFKLTHRDMGPAARYLGAEVPKEQLVWQDPLPKADYTVISQSDAKALKAKIMQSGLSVPQLIRTAWASASSFRGTDMRGGANGARIRLEPQKNWEANNPAELAQTLAVMERLQKSFNASLSGGKKVSLADMIVLGGAAAVEKAAKDAGYSVTVPFTPGRVDATQEQTDVASFAVLEPSADGFRNYYAKTNTNSPAELLVDKANQLNLTVPEMTVLVGGMRVLNANNGQSAHGVFTSKPGVLSNDFFVNLLDMSTQWKTSTKTDGIYEGYDRASGALKWTATPVDLIFGSNSELRAISEVYAFDESKEKFVQDFVAAWTKVMQADRFDLGKKI